MSLIYINTVWVLSMWNMNAWCNPVCCVDLWTVIFIYWISFVDFSLVMSHDEFQIWILIQTSKSLSKWKIHDCKVSKRWPWGLFHFDLVFLKEISMETGWKTFTDVLGFSVGNPIHPWGIWKVVLPDPHLPLVPHTSTNTEAHTHTHSNLK